MKPWREPLLLALPLLAACTLVAVPALGQKPSQNVLVVNGTGQAVPTAAQGVTTVVGTVNVGNTPNVNVTNTPSVNVANTPSVAVTNTPTVTLAGGASVAVTSPTDGQGNPTPLAVLEAVQPYQDGCQIQFCGSSSAFCLFRSIPSGKQLVIQEFDAVTTFGLEAGLSPLSVLLTNLGLNHYFTAVLMGTAGGVGFYATHQETRLYPSTTLGLAPACFVGLSGPSSQVYNCQFSGFLVDIPLGQH